jgi:hypothetical protein
MTVPPGAVTGPLQVTTSGGTATSAGYFIVLPTQDFTLVVEPSTATAIAGTSVNLKVSSVTTGGYTSLTTLGTGPLPTGGNAAGDVAASLALSPFTPSRWDFPQWIIGARFASEAEHDLPVDGGGLHRLLDFDYPLLVCADMRVVSAIFRAASFSLRLSGE